MTNHEKAIAVAKAKEKKLRLKLVKIYKAQSAKTLAMQEKFRREYNPVHKAMMEAGCDVVRAKLAAHGITPMHTIVTFSAFYGKRFAFRINPLGWYEMVRVRQDGVPCQMSEKWRCATPRDMEGMKILDAVVMLGDE